MNSELSICNLQSLVESFPFPCHLINLKSNSIQFSSDGAFFDLPKYSSNNQNFISNFVRTEGWIQCKDGYAIFSKKFTLKNTEYLFVTHGLKIKSMWKAKGRDTSFSIVCNREDVTKLVFNSINSIQNMTNLHSEIIQNTVKSLFTNQIHEIRSMNSSLYNIAYELSPLLNNDKHSYTLAKNIETLSELISSRIVLADLSSDQRLFKQKVSTTPVFVFKQFEKIIRCYTSIVKDKNNKGGIELKGNSRSAIQGIEDFEMIPLILIDNAYKYLPKNSPKDKKIVVTFNETEELIECVVSSWGPKIEDDEMNAIFEHGYRGKNVQIGDVVGSGIGLNFLKNLLVQVDGEVSVTQGCTEWKHLRSNYYLTDFKLVFKKLKSK